MMMEVVRCRCCNSVWVY